MDPLSSALDNDDDLALDDVDDNSTRASFVQSMNAALGLSPSSPKTSGGNYTALPVNNNIPQPSPDYGAPSAYYSNPPEQSRFEKFINGTTTCAIFICERLTRSPKLTAKICGVLVGFVLIIVLISSLEHGGGKGDSGSFPQPQPMVPNGTVTSAPSMAPVAPSPGPPVPAPPTPDTPPAPAPPITTTAPTPPAPTPPVPTPTPPAPLPSPQCSHNITYGDTIHSFNTSFYQIGGSSSSHINWFDAESYSSLRCLSGRRGRLASIESQEEQSFLQNLIQSHPSYSDVLHLHAWTGGFIPNPTSPYHWSLTSTTSLPIKNYTNWCPDEPSSNLTGTESCMMMHVQGTGCWNDRGCYEETAFFIVEYDYQ
ncbi:hypothetical protein TrVE_jg10604 [Triparma verrucosa]|uniref:C-type lectin domain-containing protein n=1 Tax=Triparma verrucosa TaxID=1606542 RepID=A0A9W7C5G2_9STRA|nr:hypothetical protein TrVE_jg10604 [Triparma verrucosa]